MGRNGKGNWPLQRRANYGGGGGEARPDEKMGRRKTKEWPYFNLWSIEAFTDLRADVTSPMRKVLKRKAAKKRRQRDAGFQ